MKRNVLALYGIVCTTFIRIGIMLTKLYILFSPKAMWIYLIGNIVSAYCDTVIEKVKARA